MRRTRDNTRHNRQMEGAEQEVEQGAEQGAEQRNKVEEKTATTRPEVVSNVIGFMLDFQFRCLTLCSDNAHVTFSQGQVTSEGQAVSSNSVEASQNPRRIAAKILVPCSRSAVFNFEFAFENCF